MIDNDVDLVVHVGDLSYANGDPEVSLDCVTETRFCHCVVFTRSMLEYIARSFGVQTCFQVTD